MILIQTKRICIFELQMQKYIFEALLYYSQGKFSIMI